MTGDAATFELPENMKMEECQKLHSFLQAQLAQPVQLDCSAVTRLGAVAAQLIAMGAKTWAQDDTPFELTNPTDAFQANLTTLGFGELLQTGDAN